MTASNAVTLTKELIQIESTDPGTYETAIGAYIEHFLTALPGVTLHKEEVLPGRFNLMAELPGGSVAGADSTSSDAALVSHATPDSHTAPVSHTGTGAITATTRGDSALVFICHMDTVVVGDGWTLPPFGAVEQDGRIFGRGACDMKSGLACCLSAFAYAAQLRAEAGDSTETADSGETGDSGKATDSGKTTSTSHTNTVSSPSRFRPLKLICTVDEEDFMRGAEAAIRSGWVTANDWILDSEPTNGQIQVAHKGRTWFEIEVTGHTAHASTPWKGADAIAAMAEIIGHIRREIQAAPTHPDLGISTVTFGQITGGYRPYVVPDSCKVWIDMRLVPPTNTVKATEIVEAAIALACREVPGVTARYTITGNRPYIEKDEQSPLLSSLQSACETVTGQKPVVSIFPGYTDTAVIAGTIDNHNCMSYGPGNLECAHQPDEWVAVEDILRCEEVYRQLICGSNT
ncbi:MAG: M20 family metallopeptidase [Eubacteriales bacterium]|nr:M20 family metallopeptidase [Eubacteriales bacterium]